MLYSPYGLSGILTSLPLPNVHGLDLIAVKHSNLIISCQSSVLVEERALLQSIKRQNLAGRRLCPILILSENCMYATDEWCLKFASLELKSSKATAAKLTLC